jgi:hypothetical protein
LPIAAVFNTLKQGCALEAICLSDSSLLEDLVFCKSHYLKHHENKKAAMGR